MACNSVNESDVQEGEGTYISSIKKSMKKIKEICHNMTRNKRKNKVSIKSTRMRTSIQEEVADGYKRILYDWMEEDIKPTTGAAKEAILKVSETDIPRDDWSYAEWTVYIARAIMHRADRVSVYDLYLLHEIMMRCQEEA